MTIGECFNWKIGRLKFFTKRNFFYSLMPKRLNKWLIYKRLHRMVFISMRKHLTTTRSQVREKSKSQWINTLSDSIAQNSSLKLAIPMPALRSDLQLQFDLKSRNKLRYVKDETKREKEKKNDIPISLSHGILCACVCVSVWSMRYRS